MAFWFRKMLLVGVLVLASVPVTAAERIEATYNFVWNGFVVFTAQTVVDHTPDSYEVSLDVRTRGVMRLFSRGQGVLTAKGERAEGGRITSRHFTSQGRWDGEDYRKEMFFDADGKFIRWERDWPEEWLEDYEREPVPDDLKHGPDGLSVVMALMADAPPEMLRVFDGDEVVELRLHCGDDGELKKSRHSPVSGAATKCQFAAETIAGKIIETDELRKKRLKEEAKAKKRAERYAKKHQDDEDDVGEDDEHGFPIWFQRIDGMDYSVPVRAQFNSGWGKVRMYLTEIKTSDGLHLER